MQGLAQNERSRLVERYGRAFNAGDTLFVEGDAADMCYLLQEGRVRLVMRIRTSERSLTVLKSGELFGEDALLHGTKRSASAVALSDVTVLAFERETLGALISSSPEVASRVVEQLVRRLRNAEEQLENVMLRDHPSRVVNTLLRLIASMEPSGGEGYVLELSPLELSSRVGLDVDAVKSVVQQLREGEYVRIVEEQIIIPDPEPLRKLYQLLGVKEEVRGS